jgi:hypothetical protein
MIGGGLTVSRDNQHNLVNSRVNFQYPSNNNNVEKNTLINNIDINLTNIKDSIDNNKINIILQKLSSIIKTKIDNYKIVFNPINIEKYKKNKIDYKDIIELYLLNGHDAKKDFENVRNVFTRSFGEKQYDYFKNYIIFEYYIIFYNLLRENNNDKFKLNIVTRKLAEYMSYPNYKDNIIAFFEYIKNINDNTNIEESFINNSSNIKFGQPVSDVEFFVVIALDDFRFNQEYTSFNVLNHLYSNLKNDKPSNIINKNSNQYTIFKLYDAQNNAKTQSSNLEINSFGDEDYIKQVVLLSNFIDAGNISSDALNRLQDYKKYIHRNNIDEYKKEVHNNFIELCKIFTLNKTASINIFEYYNNTNNDNTNQDNKIELNNINNIANDSNNILDILDPLTILKNHLDKTIDINKQYNILLKIDDFKIFNISIKYDKLQDYINDKSQYLEYKIKNYNNINTIASTIRNIKRTSNFQNKQNYILKLLNLKALGDFSHCIFLKIFKTYFNKTSQTQKGGVVKKKQRFELELIDVDAIKNIENKKNLNKLKNLFDFNEIKGDYLFRYNSRNTRNNIDIDYYQKLSEDNIKKNILPVKYLVSSRNISKTEFLDINNIYLYFVGHFIILNKKINNQKSIEINIDLDNLINIQTDIVNLLYNFFYILCDNLENSKNPTDKKINKKYLIEEINKYKNDIIQIKNSDINEYNKYINTIQIDINNYNKYNEYINYNIKTDIDNLNNTININFKAIGILNILMKLYLYDELLFIIMARKFYNTFINKNTNIEDELITDLIELYKEINIKNINITREDYIYKVKKYFSISQKIQEQLNSNTNNVISNDNRSNILMRKKNKRITDKINQLEKEHNTNSILPNYTRKMFMISTVDNLLKTYCLANDLSFSVDGVTIIYNN